MSVWLVDCLKNHLTHQTSRICCAVYYMTSIHIFIPPFSNLTLDVLIEQLSSLLKVLLMPYQDQGENELSKPLLPID